MLFSIIIPIYNGELHLKEAIDSVLKQTYTKFEIILINDGSIDGTLDICLEYQKKDKRIKLISQSNKGVVVARQNGVKKAKGEYFVFLDSDDKISPEYLMQSYEILKKDKIDIVCCGFKIFSENTEENYPLSFKEGKYDYKTIKKEIYPILIEKSNGKYFRPQLWGKVFEATLYRENQIENNKISIGEDHACTKACIYNSKSMYIIKECFYYYRNNPESVTKKPLAFSWDIPYLLSKHLEDKIDVSQQDFEEQLNRFTTHNLFNVSVSRFNSSKNYRDISKEIKYNLSREYYKNAIQRATYKGFLKGTIAKFVLKYKLTIFIYIYNRIKWR